MMTLLQMITSHSLTAALCMLTDGEAKMVGTVKFTNLDATNHNRVSQGIECFKEANRGNALWCSSSCRRDVP